MSKEQKQLKSKIVTGKTSQAAASRRITGRQIQSFPLLFEKTNYVTIGIGCGLIALGLVLMLGGRMEDPSMWDESVIYSFRRTVLSPIVILAGLAVQIYAIFKK